MKLNKILIYIIIIISLCSLVYAKDYLYIQQNVTNGTSYISWGGTSPTENAQSIITNRTFYLKNYTIALKAIPLTATKKYWIELYPKNSSGLPDMTTKLATSNYITGSLYTTPQKIHFVFNSSPKLINNTRYFFVYRTNETTVGILKLNYSNYDTYKKGNHFNRNGAAGWSNNSNYDLWFNVYGIYYRTDLRIILKDSNTKSLINKNMTVQIIGSYYQNSKTSITGNISFLDINLSESTADTVSIRSFSTNVIDYNTIIRITNITRGTNSTITLYLTNTSNTATTKLVNFIAQDENGYNLGGAIITILKNDPATNTYLTLTEMTTTPNGKATTILEADKVFYKYIVTYKGKVIHMDTTPSTVSLNTDDIYLRGIVGSGYFSGFGNSILYDVASDIYYINNSNKTGHFMSAFISAKSVYACLNITVYNSSGRVPISSSCLEATSGSITTAVFSPHNITIYVAQLYIDPHDGNGYRLVKQLAQYIGLAQYRIDKTEGILLFIVVLMICAFAFYMKPIAGLVVMAFLFTILGATHLTEMFIPLSVIVMIDCLCILSIFIIAKRKFYD